MNSSEQWINVEEKLPELKRQVIVYNTEGATLMASKYVNGWVAFFADGEKLMGELAATHWMPIPEPPQTHSPTKTV